STAPENSFTLRFCYLPSLGIVAVTSPPNAAHAILANLFPNDTGQNTPNPTNHHSRAAKLSSSGLFQYPADLPCRPYRWAQWLAGLHFPPVSSCDGQMLGSSGPRRAIEPSTRAVLAALRSRVRTQWALAAQLKSLADRKPACLPRFQEMMPTSNNVELGSWKELSGLDLENAGKSFRATSSQGSPDKDSSSSSAAVSPLLSSSSSTPHVRDEWERYGARYFRGVVKMKRELKKESDVEMLVEVSMEYPVRTSRVSLTMMKAKAAPPEDAGSHDLCAIANEVNAHCDTLLTEDVLYWDHLLSHQIILVMSCLATPSVDGFTGRLRRGRMRRKPVLFDRLRKTFVHR
ncbi:unnamed protein product, partial [Sphacelaria rigidula]